LCFKYPQA